MAWKRTLASGSSSASSSASDRLGPRLRSERERRLDPQIGVGMAQQIDQRHGDVDAGHRQQLQGAAEHAEIAVAVAQRGDHRVDQRGIAAGGERVHRAAPHLPVLVAERVVQRPDPLDRLDRCELLDRAPARVGARLAQFLGERALAGRAAR